MKVALVSLDQVWEDKKANSKRCLELVEVASSLGCDIVIFPEMTLTGFSVDSLKLAEDYDNSPSLNMFRDLAKLNKISIVFGMSVKAESPAKVKNNLYFLNTNGEVASVYTKLHPFTHAGEDKLYVSGSTLVETKIAGASFGSSICYDLRFPEIYSLYSDQVEIMLNIANWPARREMHWDSLLKARAIENQFYMIGVNRQGRDGNGLDYHLSSKVYNPDGQLLEAIHSEYELDVYEINLEQLKKVREAFPVLNDRRASLYAEMIINKSQ